MKQKLILLILILYSLIMLRYLIDLYTFYICNCSIKRNNLIPLENAIGLLHFLFFWVLLFFLIVNKVLRGIFFKSKAVEKWAFYLILVNALLFISVILHHSNNL